MKMFKSYDSPFSHDSVQPLQKNIVLVQNIWEGHYFYQKNYFSDSLGILGNIDHVQLYIW